MKRSDSGCAFQLYYFVGEMCSFINLADAFIDRDLEVTYNDL